MTTAGEHRYEDESVASQAPRVTFRSRRRRKRPRQPETTYERQVPTNQHDCKADDSENGTDRSLEDEVPRSLPMLLDWRATGRWRRGSSLWQARAIRGSDSDTRWRPYAARSIRYSQLQSAPSEAVLALERNGSYFVSLCGGNTAKNAPLLSLRIYGVPSPAMLGEQITRLNRNAAKATLCPLVQTVPLFFDPCDVSDESASPVATMLVQVLVSMDWSVGMAFVHHSTSSSTAWSPSLAQANLTENPATQDEDSLGTLILFTLPGRGKREVEAVQDIVQSYKCSNIRMAGHEAYTMRNLLWETHQIPHGESGQQEDHMLCSVVLNLPGHIFLNDEDDGFRMTWVILTGWTHARDDHAAPVSPSCLSTKPSRQDIITKSDEVVWDEVLSERYTGSALGASSVGHRGMEIVFEAYFRVDALLDDIRARRKATFDYKANSAPDFHYNLISIHEGRTASMVIVFGKLGRSASGPTRGWTSVGVFLQIDIFTQSYEETGWIQHSNHPGSKFLREWSNMLALNRRMRNQQVGPFCTGIEREGISNRRTWNMFYDDTNNDYDESQDADPKVWGQLLDRINKSKPARQSWHPLAVVSGPKCVSCVSLFPDCDLITNNAVRSARPVASIPCRNAPTELVYG